MNARKSPRAQACPSSRPLLMAILLAIGAKVRRVAVLCGGGAALRPAITVVGFAVAERVVACVAAAIDRTGRIVIGTTAVLRTRAALVIRVAGHARTVTSRIAAGSAGTVAGLCKG